MFTLSLSPSYSWPVVLQVPTDGGKYEKFTFDAQFKRVSAQRMREIGEAIQKGETTDVAICREVLVGWKGIVDAERQEIPFSEEALEKLLSVGNAAAAIVLTFLESYSGAKLKNS